MLGWTSRATGNEQILLSKIGLQASFTITHLKERLLAQLGAYHNNVKGLREVIKLTRTEIDIHRLDIYIYKHNNLTFISGFAN